MVGRPSIGSHSTGTEINKALSPLRETASYPQFGDFVHVLCIFLISEISLEFNFPLMPVA